MSTLAWQGIQLEISSRWSPIKIEGDFSRGYVLMADLLRPRLGLRWQTPPKRMLNVPKLLRKLMIDEVGQLATDEAEESKIAGCEYGLLYLEPQPPGRDVFIGFSRPSGRIIQVAYHAHRRERLLLQTILPTFADVSEQDPAPWSVFDLSCLIPRDMPLTRRQLNAGDLTLTFGQQLRWLSLRQIAVAQVALQRRPLDQWLLLQQKTQGKWYRPGGPLTVTSLPCRSRRLDGHVARQVRRRRFALAWRMPRQLTTFALHDQIRDRILILQGPDEALLRQTARSLSWAADVSSRNAHDQTQGQDRSPEPA